MPKRWIPLLAFMAAVIVFQPQPAQAAYIDPATTSYIIQVVSGLLITASVAIGVFFRKIQLFLVQAGARIQVWWIRNFTASGRKAAASRSRADAAATAKRSAAVQRRSVSSVAARASLAGVSGGKGSSSGRVTSGAVDDAAPLNRRTLLWSDSRSFAARAGLAALVAAGFSTVYILFAILDLYASNSADLPFRVGDVAPLAFGLWAGVTVAILAVLILLKGRVFDLVASLILGVAIAGWAQANFFNPEYGQLMGDSIQWQKSTAVALVDLIIWIVIIAIFPLLRLVGRKVWTACLVISCAFLLTGSAASLAVTYSGSVIQSQEDGLMGYLSYEDAFHVSSTHNEIVFLLDECDIDYVHTIEKEDPHFFDALTGFTRFDQNITHFNKTFPSVASILTGKDYLYQSIISDYYKQAWGGTNGLRDLKNAGYSVNLYDDRPYVYWNDTEIDGLIDNMVVTKEKMNVSQALNGLTRLSAFVYAPVIAKPSFWMSGSELSGVWRPAQGGPERYTFDDPLFHDKLREGLVVDGTQPRFMFFHLNGSHGPFVMDERGDRVAEGQQSGRIEQTRGAFQIVFDYLQDLRDLGLYDSATVVITADHGHHADLNAPNLPGPNLASLFVKPAGAPSAPLTVSLAPVSTSNFLPTMVAEAGLDPAPFGQTYFEVDPGDMTPRIFTWIRWRYEDEAPYSQTYEVIGDARRWENWHMIGQATLREDEER
ncbi:MAG: LTA synthase family protein [Propionibacteriaceae bacterium]|jgi:hypothetical protein|nr:LTA synthase family protein [Propionibacteriaceae bacterium]